MNFEQTLKDMLGAAAAAAQTDWNRLKGFAEEQLRALAANAHHLESEYLDDVAAAATTADERERTEALRIAKLRLEHGFRGIKRASEAVMIAAAGNAALAAQNAINAAVGVLTAAINSSIGVRIL
jgi:hypothetical protein